jgi:uncharacterized membrane protein
MLNKVLGNSSGYLLTRRSEIAILFCILLVGTFLRLYRLDEQSLWFDELHSIIPTAPDSDWYSIIQYSKSDQPPLFFLLLHFWYKILPYSELSGKIFCAFLGVLGVVAMYFLGKQASNSSLGLASAFITSVNLFHIYYSQELRFYSLLFLLTCISFIYFLRLIENTTLRNQIVFCTASTLLLYTHYFAIVVVMTQALIFLLVYLFERKGIKFLGNGFLCAVTTFLFFLPWLSTVVKDSGISKFWIRDEGLAFFPETFMRYFNGWWGLAFKVHFTWLLFFVFLAGLLSIVKNTAKAHDRITILGWLLLTLVIPYLYSIAKLPLMLDRYTIITLPAVLLITASGWLYVESRMLKGVLVFVFIFFTWRADHRYFFAFKKPNYRGISRQIVTENKSEKNPVVSFHAWHFNYFFEKYHAGYAVIDNSRANLQEITKNVEKFWVIFPDEHLTPDQRVFVSSNFKQISEIKLEKINAKLFERKN